MTLVAAFAASDFALIVADRRRTQLSSGTYFDDVRKIHRISDNVAVGFSGTYEATGRPGEVRGVAEHIIKANLIQFGGYKSKRQIAPTCPSNEGLDKLVYGQDIRQVSGNDDDQGSN